MTMLANAVSVLPSRSPSPPLGSRNPLRDLTPPHPTRDSRELLSSKVMIVDDEPYNIMVAQKFLESAGYERFVTVTESPQAMEAIERERPDIVLLDIMMPHVSGLEILQAINADHRLRLMPVIVLTASDDPKTKQTALQLGATDFLNKPVEQHDLLPRVRNSLFVKAHFDYLSEQSERLEKEVRRRTAELVQSRRDVIHCLARAAEFRDNETGNHVVRVGRYVGIIARELGFDKRRVEVLEQAAQLHDVGKIGIPDSILLKPGRLDPDEYDFIKKHCRFGVKILDNIPPGEVDVLRRHAEIGARIMDVQSSPILPTASLIALTHHEKWDGTGYPLGLKGEDIPIEGRMTAVADVFDALSTERPYKQALPRAECFEIMEQSRESHFDPKVLDAFFRCRREIVEVQISCADVVGA